MKPVLAKVIINVASRRNPEWEMYTALQNAAQYSLHKSQIESVVIPSVGGTLICRQRNRALRDFLQDKEGASHFLTIDDDVVLPLDAITKLVTANKQIVGGVYRLKDMDAGRTAVRISKPSLWPVILKSGIVSEAKYLSSGCLMITRQTAELLVNHYDEELWYTENNTGDRTWALYQPYVITHKSGVREYLSEDWAFCQRASDIGIQNFVHGGVKCGHWGLYRFDFYYPERFMTACGEQFDSNRNFGKFDKSEIDPEVIEDNSI